MRLLVMLAAAVSFISCAPAKAETTANQLREVLTSENVSVRQTARTYLNGLSQGMLWSNAYQDIHNRPEAKPFCVPEKMSLTVGQSESILLNHLRENPKDGDAAVGAILLKALIVVFPCR